MTLCRERVKEIDHIFCSANTFFWYKIVARVIFTRIDKGGSPPAVDIKAGAPPKHRVLEHQQTKHRILLHRLSKTSTVNNVEYNNIEYKNIECNFALTHCNH